MKIQFLVIEYDHEKEKEWGYDTFSTDCFEYIYICNNTETLNSVLNSYSFPTDSWGRASMEVSIKQIKATANQIEGDSIQYSSFKEYYNKRDFYYEKGKIWLGEFYNENDISVIVYAIEVLEK